MAIAKSLDEAISLAKKYSNKNRVIILVDKIGGYPVIFGQYMFDYDKSNSDPDSVKDLFSMSCLVMKDASAERVWNIHGLPIARYAGPYRINVVTRLTHDSFTISDGESKGTQSYIGVGA